MPKERKEVLSFKSRKDVELIDAATRLANARLVSWAGLPVLRSAGVVVEGRMQPPPPHGGARWMTHTLEVTYRPDPADQYPGLIEDLNKFLGAERPMTPPQPADYRRR